MLEGGAPSRIGSQREEARKLNKVTKVTGGGVLNRRAKLNKVTGGKAELHLGGGPDVGDEGTI